MEGQDAALRADRRADRRLGEPEAAEDVFARQQVAWAARTAAVLLILAVFGLFGLELHPLELVDD